MTDKKMSDNVLRDSLAHDCAMEESMIGKNRLSDFKPSKETLQYLLDNDVRPLKKVISIDFRALAGVGVLFSLYLFI